MIKALFRKVFGSRNDRVIKRLRLQVDAINALADEYAALTDEALRGKTQKFRERLAQGCQVDDLLVEAFATVREASKRTLGLRHYDVQLIGGMVLHSGKISEMRTGEGKTLMATLPAYLNALSGHGVHIVTVNDYLAKRDSDWMRPVYEFLGLSVAVVLSNMNRADKQAAYASDVLYATNNELGFDYLRDNMAFSWDEKVQRPLHYAVVDEVDSILIDEARTPLIISGPAEDSSKLYASINQVVPKLSSQLSTEVPPDPDGINEGDADYTIDEKQRQCYLTEQGHQHVEELLLAAGLISEGDSLYSANNIKLMHHLNAAMRARSLYHIDVDYIVQNAEIVIVDEHTGRTMPGRRWSDGLHQAVEAKEGLSIQNENQTLASITFQNFFRLYDKLSGMTGTADTEAYEFQQIYGLEVVVIPTNKPMIRDDQADLIYLTPQEKYDAIIEDIQDCQKRGQPVLVGTASIESSDLLSKLLKNKNIKHEVLNAKYHEKEAQIIIQAGQAGAVTIATNMAGRGTDIVLGGNGEAEIAMDESLSDEQKAQKRAKWQVEHQAVLDAGGLRIIGSERHESRRIDNQLRGRSGRQGDPGSSRFYLSLEDNLMRIFASDRVAAIMKRLGMKAGEAIEHSLINKAIENAQRKVEGHNFDIRKQLLEYDNVANDQRKIIYQQRNDLLQANDVSDSIERIRYDVVELIISQFIQPETLEEQWDIVSLERQLNQDFLLSLPISQWLQEDKALDEAAIRARIQQAVSDMIQSKADLIGQDNMQALQKTVMLRSLDNHWQEHLAMMDQLRQGIHLRGYAQKDPKQEYKREAFTLFNQMLDDLKHDTIRMLCTVQIQSEHDVERLDSQRRTHSQESMHYEHQEVSSLAAGSAANEAQVAAESQATFVRQGPKVGRNSICPCGSGKKFKHCHGQLN